MENHMALSKGGHPFQGPWFIRVEDPRGNRPKFLLANICTSRDEAESLLKSESVQKMEKLGFHHEIVHWTGVTDEERDNMFRLFSGTIDNLSMIAFLSFWKDQSDGQLRVDPVSFAVFNVWDHLLPPDEAIREIRRHYGIPISNPITRKNDSN
jgi:hypothetical protein